MRKLIWLAAVLIICISNPAKGQNVGIGTVTPTEKLEVKGNIKVTGNINLNGNTGTEGQVLTSQGSNPPTWANPKMSSPDIPAGQLYAESSAELFTGDIILKSNAVSDKWYDGVGLVSFRDTLFVFGGWYFSASTGAVYTNVIRYSADDGVNWPVYNAVLPFYGHAFVYFKAPNGWLYIIGGDNNNQASLQTVWRTKDMRTFQVMTTAAGWGTRSLMGGWADEESNIYIAGGQQTTSVETGPNDIWKSADGGATWTRIANNISVNGEYFLGQNICNQVKLFNKRVYVIGGGISAAAPNDSYSKRVYSAPITDLGNWRRENDLPYANGRRYISTEVWDGKLWAWSGHNAAEGNVRTICYMDNSGRWHDFKYTYTGNNPSSETTTTHAAGITIHKDMLYRVLGNLNNDAYALKRSALMSSITVRDTLRTKNLLVSSLEGSGNRLAFASAQGEIKSGSLLESDILTTTYDFSDKAVSNQQAQAQQANFWITGRGLFGGGTNFGKTLQVNGETYLGGLTGIGTSNPATYLAGIPGMAVYSPASSGISIANSNKYWLTWIQNNDLHFFEGGASQNRLIIKSGGVVNISNLAGTGTRMVVADASGNLAAQPLAQDGSAITGGNLGNVAYGVFKQKSGNELQFKSLNTVTDNGIELVSNSNDITVKNNAYAAYGKVEVYTGDATPNVIIKTVTPTDNSAGTFEVDMAGIASNMDAITGKKHVRYKKIGGTVTIGAITNIVPTAADNSLATANWTITAASGKLEIKVTGVSNTTIKWKPVFKLNEVY